MKVIERALNAVGAVAWFVMFVGYVAFDYEPGGLIVAYSLLSVSIRAAGSAVKE